MAVDLFATASGMHRGNFEGALGLDDSRWVDTKTIIGRVVQNK